MVDILLGSANKSQHVTIGRVPMAVNVGTDKVASSPPADCPGNGCYDEGPTVRALQDVSAIIALGINQLGLAG
jgi:hypothetical protein